MELDKAEEETDADYYGYTVEQKPINPAEHGVLSHDCIEILKKIFYLVKEILYQPSSFSNYGNLVFHCISLGLIDKPPDSGRLLDLVAAHSAIC